MSKAAQAVLDSALKLTEGERGEIIAGLMDSLEERDFEIDQEFEDELKKRIDDMKTGREKGIPWEEAKREIFKD